MTITNNQCKECITYAICKSKVSEYFKQKELTKTPNKVYPYLLYVAFTNVIYQKCSNLLPEIRYKKDDEYTKLLPAYFFLHYQYQDIIEYMESNFNYISDKELLDNDIKFIKSQISKVTIESDYPRNILQLIGYGKLDKYAYLIETDIHIPSSRECHRRLLFDHLFKREDNIS